MSTAFSSIKNPPQKKQAFKLLDFLVAATTQAVPPATAPAGFAYVPEKAASMLEKAEPSFFSVDLATKDPSDNVKVVALQPAIDAQAAIANEVAAQPSTPAAPVKFELEDGFTLPEIKRGGNKVDIYPFDTMAVGQTFFVAATEAKPNPAKSMASTVSSASKRYKDEKNAKGESAPRKFTVRARVIGETEGMPAGKAETANGARVYRIA